MVSPYSEDILLFQTLLRQRRFQQRVFGFARQLSQRVEFKLKYVGDYAVSSLFLRVAGLKRRQVDHPIESLLLRHLCTRRPDRVKYVSL